MLLSHVSFALSLIALVTGVSLYLWSVRAEMGPGIALAKVFGIIVIILAILDIIGSIYGGVYWHHMRRGQHNCNCPMNNSPANTNNANQSISQTPPNQPVDNQSMNNPTPQTTAPTQVPTQQ